VSVVLAILLALIGCAPALLFLDGQILLGIWSAILATGIVVVAIAMLPGEAAHLATLTRPLVIAALIPALFLILQITPLPIYGRLANPVWQSMAEALGKSVTPTVSIDIGATLLGLCRYLAWIGITLLTCAVTIDRKRAEWALFTLTAVAVVIAVFLIVNDLSDLSWLGEVRDAGARGAAVDTAALGAVLCAACIIRSYERFETRRTSDTRSILWFLRNILVCAGGFIICAMAVAIASPRTGLFSVAGGLAVFAIVFLVRRLGLGLGSAISVALVGGVVIIGVIGSNLPSGRADFALKFGSPSNPSNGITERMLPDSPLLGSGAGSYHDLVPIYRGVNDPADYVDAPTAAAQVVLEDGRPIMWGAILASAAMLVWLLRAALRRGRDSFYPAAGAGAVVILGVTSFTNPGLFETSALILAGAILGLALAQSRSRAV
jgi:hypothetical protein